MDSRTKSFKQKFADAAKEFGVKPEQVLSLKLREAIASYGDYERLLADLEIKFGIHYSQINGNLQGKGFLLNNGQSKVIIVEHETGLEILYIAGSIASLISIIPLVLQGWGSISKRFFGKGVMNSDLKKAEIRRLDSNGNLIEERLFDSFRILPVPEREPIFMPALIMHLFENDNKAIMNELQNLNLRIGALEKQIKSPKKIAKSSAKKKE